MRLSRTARRTTTPQCASRAPRSNALTLVVSLSPTDPNDSSIIRLTLSACFGQVTRVVDRGGFAGRVALGDCSPRAPTDPDVRIPCIWLFISCRCATEQAVDHTCPWEPVALLQSDEVWPRHEAGAATPRQPALPDLAHLLPELQEAEVIARDSAVPVVALQLLLQSFV